MGRQPLNEVCSGMAKTSAKLNVQGNILEDRSCFLRLVRKGVAVIPVSAFEYNYKTCWDFKKSFKLKSKEEILRWYK